ncbi:MAG: ABC transporter substrate-binding protein, partial [Alphaproteobacteria bacterium]|nr:ABC transporter substrate-binding protein [Alphaproteobacteria bacterium]
AVWEGMTDSEKAIIEAAVQAEALREYSEFSAMNADSLKVLLDEHGVQLRTFSDELFAEIKKVSGDVVAEVGATDEVTQKVYDSYMAFHEKAVGWAKLSEQGYLNARALGT